MPDLAAADPFAVPSIFVLKQKTAYDIYQCDWSSDVCSSDLSRCWRRSQRPTPKRTSCITKADRFGPNERATTFRKRLRFTNRQSRAIQIMRWLMRDFRVHRFWPPFIRARTGENHGRKRKRTPSKLFALIQTFLKRISRSAKFSLAKSIWPERGANTKQQSSSSRTTQTRIIGMATTPRSRFNDTTRPSRRADAR